MSVTRNNGGEVKTDLTRLNKLVESFTKKYYVDVGILGENNETVEGGITTAGYMAVHEFGSVGRKIPQRSWLRMPLQKSSKEIEKEIQPKVAQFLKDGDIKGLMKLLGVSCEAKIQEAFDTGGFGTWPELQPLTIRKKGSDAILIDTGAARQSITSKVGSK